MENSTKWVLLDEEKQKYINALADNMTVLRSKAGLSQEELANLIGISRQTYSSIERKVRKMPWSMFLALIFFYDHNKKTHKFVRSLSLFPAELVKRLNDGIDYSSYEMSALLGNKSKEVMDCLDDQAIQTIRTTVMLEFARCTQLPSEAVLKSFNGSVFTQRNADDWDIQAARAIRAIKADGRKDG